MKLIALIEDPAVIAKILDHLGLSSEIPRARPGAAAAAGETAGGTDGAATSIIRRSRVSEKRQLRRRRTNVTCCPRHE